MATELVTGEEWTYDKDRRRWVAEFDPSAVRDIPVVWGDFFADLESEYASHEVIAEAPLVVLRSSEAAGVIKVRLTTDGSGALKRVYPFTVRATAANGEREPQTLWLRLVEK